MPVTTTFYYFTHIHTTPLIKELNMGKEKSPKKNDKTEPLLTAKEKRAVKRDKKKGNPFSLNNKDT
jgi:hypothetical protein